MVFIIPKYVEFIMNRLMQNGYEAYIVGGSVRDALLGKEPLDYDIATNAYPEKVKDIFSDCNIIDIGEKFGTVLIHQSEGNVEITTFRVEGGYKDGRRPDWVEYSFSIEDDLARRDFTINAMAYNKDKGLIDPFNGRKDLQDGIIRAVGVPGARFNEDYLRILRGVRFASRLGFTMEKSVIDASVEYGTNIQKISWERISNEFFKILLCKIPSYGIRLLDEVGVLEIILPEIIPSIGFNQENPYHSMDVYNHILCTLDNTPPILQLRLAALFHDIAKPHALTIDEEGIGHFYNHEKLGTDMTIEILKRFRVSNELIKKVSNLVKEHMTHHSHIGEKGLKRLIKRLGEKEVFYLIDLQIADAKCANREAAIEGLLQRKISLEEIINMEEAYETRQLNIDGNDLIALGFEEGPIIGKVLEYLLEKVLEEPKMNDRKTLQKMALEYGKQLRGY